MHFRIERARRGGIAQRRERLGVVPLPGEGNSEIEHRVGIVGPVVQHDPERLLGLRELLQLQMLPPFREARVGRRPARRREAPSTPRSSGQQ